MENEPFLLYASSREFLDGDARGIRERFALRYDLLDFLAMASVGVGFLVFLIDIARIAGWVAQDADPGAILSAFVAAAVMIGAGFYFLDSRLRRAATQDRMIRDGKVLPGTIIACTGRAESSAEASLGEVPSAFLATVEYRFITPAGQEISAQAEHSRPDLRRRELPAAGASVCVLYLDDQTYALL